MQDRELPGLTHLQFLVLGVLLSGQQSGRAIRQAIEQYGCPGVPIVSPVSVGSSISRVLLVRIAA